MTQHVEPPTHMEGRHLVDLRLQLQSLLRHDPEIHLDCSNVLQLSPAGQALLVGAARTARRQGGRLHLDAPSAQMCQALRSTGLHHLLPVGQAIVSGSAAAV